MTDEAKALVERLRNTICHGDMGCERLIADDEAADLIETQAREIERLREALTNINRKASPDPERTMSEASNDLYWCACEARAALGDSHD